jgi:hypothetical protein
MGSHRLRVFTVASLLLCAGFAIAQTSQPNPAPAEAGSQPTSRSAQFQTRMDAAVHDLEENPMFNDLSPARRKEMVEFVIGNMLFALLHERAHALITEMGLPVLGREEDAADSHAVVAMLNVGTEVTHKVLIAAAKGWFLSAERNEREGFPLVFYDEHGMDRKRAYQIICLMVGSDPEKFADLATNMKMPEERQGTCAGDYSNAPWSWEPVLKPHRRAPDQPKQTVNVAYGSEGDYAAFAQALRTTGLIEMVAERVADRYVWRRPITFDVKACGKPSVR